MKEIARRVWNEPSVAIGLLVTLVLLAGALIQGTDWGVDTILVILSPLLTGLGVRPLVTPNDKVKVTPPVVQTTPPATDTERHQGF